jgi:predicted SnoaL-like aldol condensation-catalyzing enzyme
VGQDQSDTNKAIVQEAFDTLFNKHDYAAAERFWSENYTQHSAHIPSGREGLFETVKSRPPEYAYELGLIMAENDMVMMRGRFSGRGVGIPALIALDVVRMEDGLLTEHWDVLEEAASRHSSISGFPMFGETFPEGR